MTKSTLNTDTIVEQWDITPESHFSVLDEYKFKPNNEINHNEQNNVKYDVNMYRVAEGGKQRCKDNKMFIWFKCICSRITAIVFLIFNFIIQT